MTRTFLRSRRKLRTAWWLGVCLAAHSAMAQMPAPPGFLFLKGRILAQTGADTLETRGARCEVARVPSMTPTSLSYAASLIVGVNSVQLESVFAGTAYTRTFASMTEADRVFPAGLGRIVFAWSGGTPVVLNCPIQGFADLTAEPPVRNYDALQNWSDQPVTTPIACPPRPFRLRRCSCCIRRAATCSTSIAPLTSI